MTSRVSVEPSSRGARIFGIATAIWSAVVLSAVLVLTLTNHPFRAAMAIGVGIAALGIARGAWPGRPWFASRNRWSDVVVYVAVGILVIVFAPLVST